MDDGGPIERRTGWDRRAPGERRRAKERRRRADRRGGPADPAEPSDQPRPFGFRAFVDRRRHGERRSADAVDGDRRRGDDRRDGVVYRDPPQIELTPDEVLALLYQPVEDDDER